MVRHNRRRTVSDWISSEPDAEHTISVCIFILWPQDTRHQTSPMSRAPTCTGRHIQCSLAAIDFCPLGTIIVCWPTFRPTLASDHKYFVNSVYTFWNYNVWFYPYTAILSVITRQWKWNGKFCNVKILCSICMCWSWIIPVSTIELWQFLYN